MSWIWQPLPLPSAAAATGNPWYVYAQEQEDDMTIWLDVDIALSEVPVNVMPLIDDTDFKTRETGIVYNEAGMDLVWNFVTTGGVFTQTAVTPTTAGNYDWTNQGDGMYTIEIPASGGVSINNDTEGFGWFTGLATGVLPWRGPVIGFRAAAINNSLVDGPTVDANVTAMANGVITAAVIATDAIDNDAIAANAVTEIQSGLATAASIAALNNISAADVWAAGTRTLTSFGTLVADIWAAVTRTLTAGTNIVLAKGTGVTGFNDLSAGDVNAEIVDALSVDTYAEPGQEAPPATTTLAVRLRYLYKAFRNSKTQTATTLSLYNDAGTVVDQKATISDDSTIYTHGKIGTGP